MERDDEGGRDAGCCGRGEVTVEKSSVATSSVFAVGLPQAEQKRTLSAKLLPHDGHFIGIVPRKDFSSQQSTAELGRQAAGVRRWTADFGFQLSGSSQY